MATEKRDRQRANRQLKQIEHAKQEQRRKTTRRGLYGAAAVVGLLALVLGLAAIGGAFSGDDDEASDSTLPSDLTATTLPAVPPPSTTPDTVVGENGFAYGQTVCPPAEVSEPVKFFASAPTECIDPAGSYTATFVTSAGEIVVELDTENVPGTVNNFVTLARYGYYDDTRIFRADPSIDIVQGGGLSNSDNPGYTIPDEGDEFTYEEGQIVMARTATPDSAGAQWFINGGPNAANLDFDPSQPGSGTYVPFGTVTEGLEIVQEIIGSAGGADGQTPAEEVVVETITIAES